MVNILKKFYPEADDWMWTYCRFLGCFVDSSGRQYDLGVHEDKIDPSYAIVFGPEPGDYCGGEIYPNNTGHIEGSSWTEAKQETIRRYKRVMASAERSKS